MVFRALLLLLWVLETLQHLSYPINYCNMASTCIHDSRAVCASSPDGCSRKSFLDQCDMYEYNCDYGTQYMTKVTSSCTNGYQETYVLFCGGYLTSTQFTQIEISTSKNPSRNEITKGSTIEITKIVPKNVTTKSDIYVTDNKISSGTSSLTVSTSISDEPLVKYESTEKKSNKNDNHKIFNKNTPIYCCNRPLTWETTTVVTRIIEDIPIDNNYNSIGSENTQITKTLTNYNITDDLNDQTTILYENKNLTTINELLTDTVTQDMDYLENTNATEDPKQTKSDAEIFTNYHTRAAYCCNRPLTWKTTTEVTKIYEDTKIVNNNSEENKIDKTTKEDNNDPTSINAEKLDTSDSYTKYTSKYTKISTTENLHSLKLNITKSTTSPLFNKLTKSCRNRCQRPLTWLTTTMRKRKYYLNKKMFI